MNRPIYKILGGTKTKILAYASSQHLATVEDYGPDILKAKAAGIKVYKTSTLAEASIRPAGQSALPRPHR